MEEDWYWVFCYQIGNRLRYLSEQPEGWCRKLIYAKKFYRYRDAKKAADEAGEFGYVLYTNGHVFKSTPPVVKFT